MTRLEAQGKIEVHDGPRGSKLVDVAAYSRATGIDIGRLSALPSMVQILARNGYLGDGPNLQRRMAAAELYFSLFQSSASDQATERLVEKLHAILGLVDRDLIQAGIIENRSVTELSKLADKPAAFFHDRIRVALDVIAGANLQG
jgi:hypothetical protein